MLKSRFAKKSNNNFRAQKIFTDREKPRKVFKDSINKYDEKPKEIIVYYGKGGIGKTRLLKYLYDKSQDFYKTTLNKEYNNVFISLDAFDFGNPVNILMAIRNAITTDCGIFDYALLLYCTKAKMTVKEILNKNSRQSMQVMEILNEIISLGTLSACIPMKAISKFVTLIKDKKLRQRYAEEIEELNTLTEFEIFERLPYYLGLCLSYASEQGQNYVIFLDSYESLLSRTREGTFSVAQEDWLRELFLSSEKIRFIIASRDRLRWEKDDPEWGDFLNQHLVTNLSDEDSAWFLSQVPIDDAETREAIIKNACGVPLFLDLCVDLYETCLNQTKSFDINLLQKGEKLIDRYLRYLPENERIALKILSIPKSFNQEFAIYLLKSLNYVFGREQLNTIFEKSIILPIEEKLGYWKVDESVRRHITDQIPDHKLKNIISCILDYVNESEQGIDFYYFHDLLDNLKNKSDIYKDIKDKIFQAIDKYSNMGFWNEIHSSLSQFKNSEDSFLKALYSLAEIIWLRRTGRLHEANTFIENNHIQTDEMGVWKYMFRYLCIQIKHLLGYYDESIGYYKELIEEMSLIKNSIPSHIFNIVRIKYADILFLKGQFEESLTIVESMLNEKNLPIDDHIELYRIKGHIYRFNHKFKEAELIYKTALQIAEQHAQRAQIGKLYTNLTETLCTCSPILSLNWYEKAYEEHQKSGNLVELGKAMAAAAVALAKTGKIDDGLRLTREAEEITETTGYLSGKAFALAAMKFCLEQKNSPEAEIVDRQLSSLLDKINVYKYIKTPL